MNLNIVDKIKLIKTNKNILKPISLHDLALSKYALILIYYPMMKSKLDIYLKLDKKQRVGMLNRHILSVASKINIYQVLIKDIVMLRNSLKRYKRYISEDDNTILNKEYWERCYNDNQKQMSKQYNLLLDIMIEEINRRQNPKYLRKKKINEIEQNNLQN